MKKCFICTDAFNSPEELCEHIKDIHNLKGKGEFKCSCSQIFDALWKFKRHLKTCSHDVTAADDMSPNEEGPDFYHDFIGERQSDQITIFQALLRKIALELACKMIGNMSFPRNAVFEIIADLENFVTKIIEGLETIIMPCIASGSERTVDDFILAVISSFTYIKSECKLDTELKKRELMSPVTMIDITGDKILKYTTDEVEESENDKKCVYFEYFDACDDCDEFEDCADFEDYCEYSDCEEESEVDDRSNKKSNIKKLKNIATIAEMPIAFQIKKFLELPNVFEKMKSNLSKLNEENKLQHFINGELWKEKLKLFSADQIVFPLFLYMDEAQVNNALGTHQQTGKENFCYYSFPLIPHDYQSRLDNIFVAYLHPGEYIKDHGNERCFNSLIETLTDFAYEGVTIKIAGEEHKICFVVGLFLGDNLEVNNVLGFARSFSANYYCRFCQLYKDDMQTQTREIADHLRNRGNYNDDVIKKDFSNTGIQENCVFNKMPLFHATESASVDLMHDILLGILHYNLSEIILYFLRKKQKYFSLVTLNKRMKSLPYGLLEIGNKPTRILLKKLKTRKFTMTASEMLCFANHLTFMIGDLVPVSDRVWQFYLTTMKFVDLCYLPSYNDKDIEDLENIIEKMNNDYITLFKQKLKPKHHLAIHYPRLTKRFGPLRNVQSMRFEAKHRVMKNYTKNISSRVNVSYSLAKKLQYNFASRIITSRGLEDEIITNALKKTWMAEEAYYSKVAGSVLMEQLAQQECLVTDKVIVNGILFAHGLCLPDFTDGTNKKINRIVDIVLSKQNDLSSIFAICKTFDKVRYDEHYGCHFFGNQTQQAMCIINIKEFLSQHYWPVKPQVVSNRYMFRCKRF